LPLAELVLAEAGLGFDRVDAIAFGSGPGSFTGLRVACGVAQGLAIARDLPLIAIGSLEAMAAQCAFDAGGEKVIVAVDARMGEVYFALFDRGELVGEVGVHPPEAVPLPTSGRWLACGNGFSVYPALRERVSPWVDAWRSELAPSAEAVVRVAAPRLARGERIDPAEASPLYVRNKVAKTVAERLADGGRA
jgi:tRNA threonylcarbamoyladenosine biosynthesis protein TsaB